MELEQITIHAVGEYTGMNSESVERYFRAKNTVLPLLKDGVISPFEQALKDSTGYSNENLPQNLVEIRHDLGDISFVVKSEQRTKRPRLVDVYDGVNDFLQFVQTSYEAGVQRKGVRTIEGQAYIGLSEVMGKIAELNEEVSVPEVKQTIKYTDKRNLKENGSPVAIPVSYGVKLTEGDALLYVRAKDMHTFVKKSTVDPFEATMKMETGYDKKNVPNEVEVKWNQIANHLIRVQSTPEETVQYKGIIDSLVKEAPAKITAKTKIGDLVKIRDGMELNGVQELYDPRLRDGEKFINLEGALKRLGSLKEEFTNPSVNQSLKHYPAV